MTSTVDVQSAHSSSSVAILNQVFPCVVLECAAVQQHKISRNPEIAKSKSVKNILYLCLSMLPLLCKAAAALRCEGWIHKLPSPVPLPV